MVRRSCAGVGGSWQPNCGIRAYQVGFAKHGVAVLSQPAWISSLPSWVCQAWVAVLSQPAWILLSSTWSCDGYSPEQVPVPTSVRVLAYT
eukprot:661554-Alexandrium_andersonii.AAC.1